MPEAKGRLHAHLVALRASRSYGYVLGLVAMSFLFTAAAPDTNWARSVLVLIDSAALIAALWTSRAGPIEARSGLATFAVVVALVQLTVDGGSTMAGLIGILEVMLLAAIAVVIGRGVITEHAVNPQSVVGAICVYVLVGLLFVNVYGAVAAFGSDPFFAQGTDGTPALRLYFSFVTLATLGYGDYTPARNPGQTLAVIEAVLGQLYLVTVIGVLVGRLSAKPPQIKRARGPSPP